MTRAYIVSRPIRGCRYLLVYADTAAEAVELAAMGEGEAIDAEITGAGRGTARRSPNDDEPRHPAPEETL